MNDNDTRVAAPLELGARRVIKYSRTHRRRSPWPMTVAAGFVILSPIYVYAALCILSFARYGHAPHRVQPFVGDYNHRLWKDVNAYSFMTATLLTAVAPAVITFWPRMAPKILPISVLVSLYATSVVLYVFDPFGAREWIFE